MERRKNDRNCQSPKEAHGNAFTGILGAFLGAATCVLLAWIAGLLYIPSVEIVFFVAAPLVMAGYRWCRGLKNKAFAYITTGLFTMFVTLLIPAAAGAAQVGADKFLLLLAPDYWPGTWKFYLVLLGLSLFLFWWFKGIIERYAAPVNLRPQYEARKYAGGALYNLCPQQIPKREIPRRFYVGGKLEVDGEMLRTTPSIRKGRTFSVWEIAGVVLGGCTGSNVLYDRDFQVLAKFAWSMDGADLLALYLLEHGVAFDNLPLALDRRTSQKPVKPTPQVGGWKTKRH